MIFDQSMQLRTHSAIKLIQKMVSSDIYLLIWIKLRVAFFLSPLSVFEFASIYLALVRSHRRKAQECQKIMCLYLC